MQVSTICFLSTSDTGREISGNLSKILNEINVQGFSPALCKIFSKLTVQMHCLLRYGYTFSKLKYTFKNKIFAPFTYTDTLSRNSAVRLSVQSQVTSATTSFTLSQVRIGFQP